MATTNEDAVALATARFADGRVLILRHLPDRGTIEIGWWRRDERDSLVQVPPMLELAAEAAELQAFAGLAERVAAAEWAAVAEGAEIAAAGPFSDGVRLAALRTGDGTAFVRQPETDLLVLLPRPALERMVEELLPAAFAKRARLGFGRVKCS